LTIVHGERLGSLIGSMEVSMAIAVMMSGSPGAGKGDMGKVLEALGFKRIESGRLFRRIAEMAAQGDAMALHVYKCMHGETEDKKTLVDDDTTMKVVKDALMSIPVEFDVVFDAPRSADQVSIFCDMMHERSVDKIISIQLEASPEVCRERLNGRGKKNEGDVRKDDTDSDIREKRLTDYAGYSLETIEALKRYTHYIEVDATPKPLEVAAMMLFKLCLAHPNRDMNVIDNFQKLLPHNSVPAFV
jgi:adenylate kinase family enzyme